MVLQGIPLRELGQSYDLTFHPERIQLIVQWFGDFIGPAAVEGAEPAIQTRADHFPARKEFPGRDIVLHVNDGTYTDRTPFTFKSVDRSFTPRGWADFDLIRVHPGTAAMTTGGIVKPFGEGLLFLSFSSKAAQSLPRAQGIDKSFEPDPEVIEAFDDLIEHISALARDVLNKGNRNSLMKKLENSEAAYIRGQPCTALNIIHAFLNETQAMQKRGLGIADYLYFQGLTLRSALLVSLPAGYRCPASRENAAPVADAGEDHPSYLADTVQLDGSGSYDVDGDLLSFHWSFLSIPEGSAAVISDPEAVMPTFYVDEHGTYVVQLIVDDGMADSVPDTVTITTENSRPVAAAGEDQTVFTGDTVTLDGGGSYDVDGDPLTYRWSFTSVPDGSAATLEEGTTASPFFVPDVAGIYVVQLIVNDGAVDSDADTVIVTAELRIVTVPDVAGMPQPAAEAAILAAGLTIGAVYTMHSTTVPEGAVMSQDPAAGSSVVQGSPVDVTVSLGPVIVSAPDLAGLTLSEAETALLAAGLSIGVVTEVNNDTVPAGRIISQNPPGGASIPGGSSVDLVVSLGPITVPVPDVAGLAQADAEAALIAAGLSAGTITQQPSDTVPAGNVISQDPPAGTSVAEGSSVDLVVSIGANEAPIAVDDTFVFSSGNALTIPAPGLAANDSDPDGDPLSVVLVRDPLDGTLALNEDGSFTYTPAHGFNQTEFFSYLVSDGFHDSNVATVSIEMGGIDLKLVDIDTGTMTTNPQSLDVSGTVGIGIQNTGTRPFSGSFSLLVFEDSNNNGVFDSGIDNVLGIKTFSGTIDSDAIVHDDIPVSGTVLFRDNLVYVYAGDVRHSGESSRYQPPVGDFHAMVKWQWGASIADGVGFTPVVAPLIDTNNDGLINDRDIPAVVLVTASTSGCRLVALRGDTGQEIFAVPGPAGPGGCSTAPAVGDIDGDGVPEILSRPFYRTPLYAFNNDGTIKWTVAVPDSNARNIVLADLDDDGLSEVIIGNVSGATVVNADGTIRWYATSHPSGFGGEGASGGGPRVADLDMDGIPEIVTGSSVWDRDGNLLWSWKSHSFGSTGATIDGWLDGGATRITFTSLVALFPSWTAIANLDSDPYPEIITVSGASDAGGAITYTSMWIFEHDGRIHAGPFGLFHGVPNEISFRLGPPTVADFDGDGEPEIAVSVYKRTQIGSTTDPSDPTRVILNVYQKDGTLLWREDMIETPAGNSSYTATAFDFDGDGASELVFQDSQKLYILNGADGSTLFEFGVNFWYGLDASRYPTIADVDNDGSAEIIVPAFAGYWTGAPERYGVLVLGHPDGSWVHARRVWNQWQYNVTNVNDDGSIPAVAVNSWEVNNSHREQVHLRGLDPFAAPDLTISKIDINAPDCPAGARISARVGNGGSLQAGAGVSVDFYDGDPSAGGTSIGSAETTRPLFPGEFEDVTLDCMAPVPAQIFAHVNEVPAANLIQTDNLSLLPHTWAEASGLSAISSIPVNLRASDGIDGNPNTYWTEPGLGFNLDTGPSFYEVRLPLPVNATSVTIENYRLVNTGFLAGDLTFSNGFSVPVTLDANGEGSVSFPEQTGITWIRITASSTKIDGASLTEFIVGGSYIEPHFLINEGEGLLHNNEVACGAGIIPCNLGVNLPPRITSDPPTLALAGALYAYQVEAVDPDHDPLSFSLGVAPAGMAVDPATGLVTWTPDDADVGDNPVAVEVRDARGLSDIQSFTLRVAFGTIVPDVVGFLQADAEAAISAATLSVGTVSTAGSDTVPVDHVIGQDPGAGAQAPQGAPVDLVVSLGRAPVADAGTDQTAGEGVPVTLDGSASFDPDGDAISFSWTQLEGPPVSLSDPSAEQPAFVSPTVFADALLLFQLEVSDGRQTTAATVNVTVLNDVNEAPVADAGPDLFRRLSTQVTLDGSASYDPNGDTITYSWTLVSVPAGSAAALDDPLSETPHFIADAEGEYLLELTVADGALTSSADQVTVTVANDGGPPTVAIIADPPTADIGADVRLIVTANDDQAIALLTLTVNGTPVALDASGVGIFSSAVAGSFEAVATATDFGGNQATALTTFRVRTLLPVIQITSPLDGDSVTNITDITGTVTDGTFVEYSVAFAPVDGAFKVIASGTSPVVDGVIGQFDPTLLPNGAYILRIEAKDSQGNRTVVRNEVNVTGDVKLGNFRLSFTDLSVPVSGIPITITRTYDTLVADREGDFGYGWRLEMYNASLTTSVEKTGLEQDMIFNPFKVGTRVYVTTPGGKREGFTFEPKLAPEGLKGGFLKISLPEFVPDPGVTSTLWVDTVDLFVYDPNLAYLTDRDPTHIDEVFVYGAPGVPYNPGNPAVGNGYYLTTEDGITYNINGITGEATSISDPQGNALRISTNGISSPSSGAQVLFERDSQGRITAVVDPMGNRISYEYDAQGDLVAVTDREDNVTQFVYRTDHPHYLDEVIDPLGRTGAKSVYNDEGRLIGIIDADGNLIEFEHDLNNNTQVIRDRLGNPTTYEYDDRGNILTEIDALGNVTERTYDEDNNMLSETDPLGNTTTSTYDTEDNKLTETDPLGNVATFTYQTIRPGGVTFRQLFYSQVASTTDPLGNTTTSTYDDRTGNLLTKSDPLGNTTSFSYDAAGNMLTITDPLGNTTSFTYDSMGNQIRTIDPLGNVVEKTYDATSNQLTETSTRMINGAPQVLTKTFAYDKLGRLIQATDADGKTIQFSFTETGKEKSDTDGRGNTKTYGYDSLNRLIRTTFPDGTTEIIEYDAKGRRIATTDRAGWTTGFTYNELDKLVMAKYPDGSTTSVVYDAAGNKISEEDENGNITTFTYDATGRNTSIGDALGGITTFTYDAAGNRISQIDRNGQTTTFEYDSVKRLVRTNHPDGTFTAATYSANNLKLTETDQAGQTTSFQYDILGRLVRVVDALGNVTRYTYDELSNRISQTDAVGRTTQMEHDGLGRLTKRILPLGQQETFVYDANGNKVSRTDFNGDTMTFMYDSDNRLIQKTYQDGSTVEFAYTPTGLRTQAGGDRYAYDSRGRLLTETKANGDILSYTYDAVGNRTSITTPQGTTTYTYDALNRLATVTDPDGSITYYTYDAVGNRERVAYPNGTFATYDYDEMNRLIQVDNMGPGGVISSYAYTLGPSGNRTRVVESHSGRTVDYTYDAVYRLIEERIDDPADGLRTIAYTYDAAGNRLTKDDSIEGITSYTYDDNDRLLTEISPTVSIGYNYDKNGNMVRRSDGLNTNAYTYDFENHLMRTDLQVGTTPGVVSYTYDADGMCKAKTSRRV
jgi:YD repeat-containing protein